MAILKIEIELSDGSAIDGASERLVESLLAEGVERKKTQRIRLSAEEILLRWRDRDESGGCTLTLERQFGELHLTLV